METIAFADREPKNVRWLFSSVVFPDVCSVQVSICFLRLRWRP